MTPGEKWQWVFCCQSSRAVARYQSVFCPALQVTSFLASGCISTSLLGRDASELAPIIMISESNDQNFLAWLPRIATAYCCQKTEHCPIRKHRFYSFVTKGSIEPQQLSSICWMICHHHTVACSCSSSSLVYRHASRIE